MTIIKKIFFTHENVLMTVVSSSNGLNVRK